MPHKARYIDRWDFGMGSEGELSAIVMRISELIVDQWYLDSAAGGQRRGTTTGGTLAWDLKANCQRL